MIKERIQALRQRMLEKNIDMYLIPTSDYHESEYVGKHFAAREFMSGFTGSAGTLIVGKEEAGLWADGRYFIQAENQIKGTGITLYKMGVEGVPTVEEFLTKEMPEGGTLGFDGKVVNAKLGRRIEDKLKEKKVQIAFEDDLVDELWEDRPELSAEPAFLLDVKYSGKSTED